MRSSRKGFNPFLLVIGILVIFGVVAILVVNSRYRLFGETCPQIDATVPMYGNVQKCGYQKLIDDVFIFNATNGKPQFENSRKRAADAAIRRSYEYSAKGDLDTAMRRLNQAWLLTPDDYRIFWRYGNVLAQKKNFDDAFTMYEKALSMKPSVTQDHSDILCDYALATLQDINARDKNAEEKARNASRLLEESITIDPENGSCHSLLALTLLAQGKYFESWQEVHKAEELGVNTSEIKSIREKLSTQMPEPHN